jgi:hypothetical protein
MLTEAWVNGQHSQSGSLAEYVKLQAERDSLAEQVKVLREALVAIKEADDCWTTNVDMWIAKADEIAGKK